MAAQLKMQSGRTIGFLLSRVGALAVASSLMVGAVKAQTRAPGDPVILRAGDGGEVRSLIVGIDAYRYYRPLKGAVADARDLETALRSVNAKDIVTLIDDQADRAAVLREIDRLITRTRDKDLVILAIAGHGAQEPERVKGSEPDGMENVFLLGGFEPSATGSQQRVLGKEFNHFIKQLELKGARVIFVADTCHGGGMARDIDPRAEPMSFRQVPSYRLTVDRLAPVTPSSAPVLNELDFEHTEFLAAVDRKTKAPEVAIPGVPGLRGALSYSMARAIEGKADRDGDRRVTVKELFTNVRQMVYQLSNQRQNIVTVTSPSRNPENDVVFEFTRSLGVAGAAPASPQASIGPKVIFAPTTAPEPVAPPPPPPLGAQMERPVKVAALDGNRAHFTGVTPRDARIEIVAPVDNPDIVWDSASRDVIAWGDVVAYKIDKADLPSVIDRTAAIRELKQMASHAPQVIKIAPNDSLHRDQSQVQVELADLAGRSLIMFNIAGDGTVQLLYPIGSDAPVVRSATLSFPVRVRAPFGADQVVAITSGDRMKELEQVVAQLERRRSAAQMIRMIQRYAPRDARIGSVGLFTAP